MPANELTKTEQKALHRMIQGQPISQIVSDIESRVRIATASIPRGYKVTEDGVIQAKTWYRRVR